MWYLMACRSCLTTKGKLIRIGLQARKLFCIITGLELEEDDGFPQYFCPKCFVLIKKALLFRRRSRRAHFVLKEIHAAKKQVSQADVEIVNRHKTNLISPYSLWKPENAVTYSYKTKDAEESQPEEITPDIEAALKESCKTEFDINCDLESKSIKIEFKNELGIENKTTVLQSDDLKTEETDNKTEETDIAQELVKEQTETLKSSSILVNIKPANWREIEKEEEERVKNERLAEIEAALQEIHGDDFCKDDMANNDHTFEDIDMEDVFKGLKEESPKESESEPEAELEPEIKPEPERIKKKKTQKRYVSNENMSMRFFTQGMRITHVLEYAFTNMKIRYLTIEEQCDAFNNILNTEPFSKAMYKCNICVKTFSDVDKLYEHVSYHNTKLKYDFGCKVCADRFPSEDALNQHGAFYHWYEYKCSRCKTSHYSMDSVISCLRTMKITSRFDKHFRVKCLTQKQMYSTMDVWTGVKEGAYGACPRCKIYFSTEKQFNKHKERHQEQEFKYFECDICKQRYSNNDRLQNHMRWWHAYSYTCRKCKIRFMNRIQANHHMTRGKCSLICYVCNQTFDSNFKRVFHIYSAHRVDCGMCGHECTNAVRMYVHQLKTHGYFRLNSEAKLHDPRFYCKDCDIYFTDEKVLYLHLCRKRHDAAKEYQNGCRSCMLLFDSFEAREEHRLTCEDNYPKQCEFCTTIVSDKETYLQHKVEQHKHRAPVIPEGGDSRLCEHCGKTVKHILQHVRTHIAEETAVQCKYCPMKSLSYSQHVSHVIYNHTAKPYRCDVCELRFLYRSNCRDHILKTHAPVMLYGCEVCLRRFSHLDYLHDHCRKIHNVDLKKIDKSVYLPKRMFGKIYTYPHMKIDGSLIDVDILEKTPVELCDYMDENEQRVPFTEAFFFDLDVAPIPGMRKKKSKKKTKEEERIHYLRKRQRLALKKAKKENKANKTIPHDETTMKIIDHFDDKEMFENAIVNDNQVTSDTFMEIDSTEVETEDIVGQLIEKDGKYFVLANDVLYTIEDDYVEKLQERDGVMQIVDE